MFDRVRNDFRDNVRGLLNTHDSMLAAASAENRWRAEIEKVTASSLKSWMPDIGFHDVLQNQAQLLAQEQSVAAQLAQGMHGDSWRDELEKARVGHLPTWAAANLENAWLPTDIHSLLRSTEATMLDHWKAVDFSFANRQAEEIDKIRRSLDATHLAGIPDTLSESFSTRIASSYNLACQAATASLVGAFANSAEILAKQHASESERIIQKLVDQLHHSPLGLATTWELSQLQSLQRQFSALGIDVETWLVNEKDNSAQKTDRESQQIPGTPVLRLDDLRQLLINLVASAIWAAMTLAVMSGTGGEQNEQSSQRLERLIEELPELIAPLVEQAVRKELGLNKVTFVVRERRAHLRAIPQAGSKVTAEIFPNQVLTLLEESGKWIHVEFYDYVAQDVREGWVLKKYVQRLPATPAHL